jgi:hypothetical protein
MPRSIVHWVISLELVASSAERCAFSHEGLPSTISSQNGVFKLPIDATSWVPDRDFLPTVETWMLASSEIGFNRTHPI